MIAIADGDSEVNTYVPVGVLIWGGGMAPNHSHGANVVFCDGHVEYDKVSNWLKADDAHRRRWNIDNQAHAETWANPADMK